MNPLLRVDHLTTVFNLPTGEAAAVDDVSFDVREGETLGLVGESGSGKSVTALSIMRLVQPPGRIRGGRVTFKGRDLMALGESEMRQVRGADIALIFQEPMTALNPVFTVGDQIAETLLVHGRATRRDARSKAIELLGAVKIPDAAARVDDYPHQLSGGMRQRVLIAIALSCRPSLVIADEPTSDDSGADSGPPARDEVRIQPVAAHHHPRSGRHRGNRGSRRRDVRWPHRRGGPRAGALP